jgi:hypothetical protein
MITQIGKKATQKTKRPYEVNISFWGVYKLSDWSNTKHLIRNQSEEVRQGKSSKVLTELVLLGIFCTKGMG